MGETSSIAGTTTTHTCHTRHTNEKTRRPRERERERERERVKKRRRKRRPDGRLSHHLGEAPKRMPRLLLAPLLPLALRAMQAAEDAAARALSVSACAAAWPLAGDT